jgi:hypothetical protein
MLIPQQETEAWRMVQRGTGKGERMDATTGISRMKAKVVQTGYDSRRRPVDFFCGVRVGRVGARRRDGAEQTT